MFARTRRQLVVWYVTVCAAVFLLVSVAVYIALATALDNEVNDALQREAERVATLTVQAESSTVRGLPLQRTPSTTQAPSSGTGSSDDRRDERRELPRDGDALALDDEEHIGGGGLFSVVVAPDGTVIAASRDQAITGLPYAEGVRQALAGKVSTADLTAPDGTPIRVFSRPVSVHGERDGVRAAPGGVVQVGQSLVSHRHELHVVGLTLSGGTVAGLLLTLGGAVFLAGRALRPIRASFDRQRAFVADASHELRTPLALIRADAEVLQRSLHRETTASVEVPHAADARAEERELADDIITEAGYLSRLVDDMLLLASSEAGQLSFEREILDVRELVETICAAMQRQVAERGLAFRLDLPAGDAPIFVRGDALRLRQLLLILLDNALKYTPRGEVTVTLRRSAARSAEIVVQDCGPGIPPASLPHIFERFYRVDKARSREMGGTGLGLSIARMIATDHGATLEAANVAEGGARFTLQLPAIPVTAYADDH